MNLNERLDQWLAHLHERANEHSLAIDYLRQVSDLALFPTDLQSLISLVPNLYNATTRRFEFQRTPGLFVLVSGLVCAAATDTPINSVSGAATLDPTTGIPKDGTYWKVLGGLLTISQPTMVDIKDGTGGRTFFHGAVIGNSVAQFSVPGNGYSFYGSKPLTVKTLLAATVDMLLFVSEESDTVGKGGA